MKARGLVLLVLLFCHAPLFAGERLVVVISDLHFGLGRKWGKWNPKEDFRWTAALRSFCDAVSKEGDDRVDLVIAGDFLELWQFPTGESCKSSNPDQGCTVGEMARLAATVSKAHAEDFRILSAFADRGENRVYIVPGNHDAALMIDDVWKKVAPRFTAKPGRVVRVTKGVWSSVDGVVVVEHGHQIWPDVNLYHEWPGVMLGERMRRPWGEFFVQRLYNDEEDTYSTIDNLVASSAGVKYRAKDRGRLATAADFFRLLRFSLFETSAQQRLDSLGAPAPGEKVEWDIAFARSRGHRLFADALTSSDPLRVELLTAEGDEWTAKRAELDALVADSAQLPDEEVRSICDQIALRKEADPASTAQLCRDPSLLYAASKVHIISRERVMKNHLQRRLEEFPAMRAFIYGHTHGVELPWSFDVTPLRSVWIANTGAFQRLVDDGKFAAAAAARNVTPVEALRQLTVEDLPPCYSAVLIRVDEGLPQVQVKNWIETAEGGRFGEVCDTTCLRISRNCP